MLQAFAVQRRAALALLLALLALPAAARDYPDLSTLLFEAVPLPESAEDTTARKAGARTSGSATRPRQPIHRQISEYEAALAELQARTGPYAAELAERQRALGALYEEAGDLAGAVTAYESALHSVRVNQGLFAPSQIPLVRDLIRVYQAQQQIEEADRRHEYLFYLAGKNHSADSAAYLQAKAEWADWNVKAYHLSRQRAASSSMRVSASVGEPAIYTDYVPVRGPLDSVYYVPRNRINHGLDSAYARQSIRSAVNPRLLEAQQLYREIAEATAQEEAGEGLSLTEVRRKNADLAYAVKRHQDQLLAGFSGRALQPMPADPEIARGYRQGREALEVELQALQRRDDTSPEQLARAHIDLADWHLAYDRVSQGHACYRAAWEVLQENGMAPEAIAAILSPFPPLQIPVFATHPHSRRVLGLKAGEGVDYDGHIDLQFDLNDDGRARRIEVLASSEGTPEAVRRALLSHLRGARLRPLVEAGEAVDRDNLRLRYYYAY